MIQCGVVGLNIVVEKFDTLFCNENAAKVAVPDCLKIGQHVYDFVTVL